MQSNSLSKQEWRSGISLASIYVLRMLGLFMVIPVIAVAATSYPDYTPLWVGLAIGGYGLTQAILQIPMGLLSDKWGRKPVIYLGLFLFAIGSLIAGLADSMWLLTIGRILQGSGAIAGAIMALATDVTRESQRTKIMALIGVSIGMSFYIALLLGPLIAANLGMQGIFLITAALSLLCFPLVKFGIADVESTQPAGDSLPRLNMLPKLIKHQHLWRLNYSVLVIHLLITCFFVQVPILLIQADVPLGDHWMLYGCVLLISVLGLLLLMKASEKLAVGLSFKLALLIIAGAFFVLITSEPSWINIAIAGTLFFSGFNFMEAKLPSMVSSIAPAGSKGSAMGIYASHQFFGAFLGGVISGLLNSYFSSQYIFIMCLLVIFLLSLITKGLAGSERLKRITLKPDGLSPLSQQEATALLQQWSISLSGLAGVREAKADIDDNAIYLKVDVKTFDMSAANAILKTE